MCWFFLSVHMQRECQDLGEFVRKVLGPYSMNVTTATGLCSASLCEGKGRCVRQNPDSSAYLHLPPPADVTEKVTETVIDDCYWLRVLRILSISCITMVMSFSMPHSSGSHE